MFDTSWSQIVDIRPRKSILSLIPTDSDSHILHRHLCGFIGAVPSFLVDKMMI